MKKQIWLISLFDIKEGELSYSLRRKYQKQVDWFWLQPQTTMKYEPLPFPTPNVT